MNGHTWSPSQYLRFEEERTRPARDLLAQVPLDAPRRVVDMGCGPGNSTQLLATRWPKAEIIGLDSSETMLESARRRLPDLAFALADAASWTPEPATDVVFANAIYQWLPNHIEVLPRVLAGLAPGGALAVQVPDNLAEPTHRLMREVGESMQFARKFAGAARTPLAPARDYYEALRPAASRVDVWHTIYVHVLDGPEAIIDWLRGTGLGPVLARLDEGEKDTYLDAYLSAVAKAYPRTSDGKVLLRFPRLFMVALR
jgi:trans-aconitate 2-methyltransferase